MKILLAHNSPYFPAHGGGDRSNRLLMEALAARGHHCRVLSRTAAYGTAAQEELLRDLSARGVAALSAGSGVVLFRLNSVEVHTVANHPNLRAYFQEQVEAFAPDVIVASTDDPAQVLLEAALRTVSPRIVYLARATLPLPFGPDCAFPGPSKAAALQRVDAVVGVSEYVAAYIRKWGGIPGAIHVPISLIEAGPHPLCGRFDNEFVTMVNPSATKGISILLKLAEAMPEVAFAAVPTWGTNAADRAALAALPNIAVLDPVDDVTEILKRTRVVLIPSLWAEARSRMVVESLARGVPVLASDVGGLGEAMMGVPYLLPVRPIVKYQGKLDENMVPVAEIPDQDIEPWRAVLARLVSDRGHWEELSARGREAAGKYLDNISAAPFEALLQDVLSREPKRATAVPAPASPPSLSEDRRRLLELRLKSRKAEAGPGEWFVMRPAAAGARRRFRLFCFPFAGGGAAFFRGWQAVLGSDWEVIPALLPGRESRLRETPEESFDELVRHLSAALSGKLDPPFAFFGHSMGAVLAFEIARRLRDNGSPLPAALLVSGARAPQFRLGHIPGPEPTDGQLLDQLRQVNGGAGGMLDPSEALGPLLPALRADTKAYRRYVYQPGLPLPVPIHAYGGKEDPQVNPDHLKAWAAQTSSSFSLRLFPGGHFYLRQQALPFLQALARDLSAEHAACQPR